MDQYIIDGIFLTKRVTGIQRYAIEITRELDKLLKPRTVKMLVPCYYDGNFEFQNIDIVKYGNHSRRIWEQVDFCKYIRKNNSIGIYFENTIPLIEQKGIVVLHDISLKVNPKLFLKTNKDRMSYIWRKIIYRAIINSEMKIVTVSKFSQSEIQKYYGVNAERITVLYNAWQHIDHINEDETILKKYSIEKKSYYFGMATMAQNKNFRWIANAAENNKNDIFVIAGGGKVADVIKSKYRDLDNLIYLGYVTDEEAKTLMHYCKAFVFPSFYEGFGIPPLEAIASGAPEVILSDIPCFREIYGDNATYISPYNYNIKMSDIESVYVNRDEILSRFSWKQSAKGLFEMMG